MEDKIFNVFLPQKNVIKQFINITYMKNLFKHWAIACLACGLFLSLTSCSEDDSPSSKGGTVGEIFVDLDVIGSWQTFTLACPYSSGSNLYKEEIYYVDASGLSHTTNCENNNAYITFNGLAAGEYPFILRVSSFGNDGKDYSVESPTKTIKVVATDIRNSFWGDSKEVTKRNLSNFTTMHELDDSTITVNEVDKYFSTLNYNSEDAIIASSGLSYGNRKVFYNFSSDSKLQQIDYITDGITDDIVTEFVNRARVLKTCDKFEIVSLNNYVTQGSTLTEVEQSALSQLTTEYILSSSHDIDFSALTSPILENRLVLSIELQNEKNRVIVETYYMGGPNGVAIYSHYTKK